MLFSKRKKKKQIALCVAGSLLAVLAMCVYGYNASWQQSREEARQKASASLQATPAPTQIVADAGQPIGYIVVKNGRTGLVAELYKHVYVDGVEQDVIRENKTTYQMFPRTITVGVAGDPDLSNELQAAVATQDEAQVNATLASCLARMQ